jgi:hypothetical protein
MANQSLRYTGFCSAAKVEVLLSRTFISVAEAVGGVTRTYWVRAAEVACRALGAPAPCCVNWQVCR